MVWTDQVPATSANDNGAAIAAAGVSAGISSSPPAHPTRATADINISVLRIMPP
jgi:hypothetical protein